jgi:hypothetical protein
VISVVTDGNQNSEIVWCGMVHELITITLLCFTLGLFLLTEYVPEPDNPIL